jgi:hypothetical protein
MDFHHIGYVVDSIKNFEKSMIFQNKIISVVDDIQNAELALYTNFSNAYLELIQPLDKTSYTWNSLMKKGNHYHHVCYSINQEELISLVNKLKLIEVLSPIPAILFENKMVTFYLDRNKKLVEFLIL